MRVGKTYTLSYSQIAVRNLSWMSHILVGINEPLLNREVSMEKSTDKSAGRSVLVVSELNL